jgi:hypothetical protein
MFIYAHWTQNGSYNAQAFFNSDKAAAFVIATIDDYVKNETGPTLKPAKRAARYNDVFLNGDVPEAPAFGNQPVRVTAKKKQPETDHSSSVEFAALKAHLEKALETKSFDDAKKVIALYEDYMRYVKLDGSIFHDLKKVRLIND